MNITNYMRICYLLLFLLAGCASFQKINTVTSDGFTARIPSSWRIDDNVKKGCILITRRGDNEDTGLVALSVKKLNGQISSEQVLKLEKEQFESTSEIAVVNAEKRINHFASLSGIGIRKSGYPKGSKRLFEYIIFIPDGEPRLKNCSITIMRMGDQKSGTLAQLTHIIGSISLESH